MIFKTINHQVFALKCQQKRQFSRMDYSEQVPQTVPRRVSIARSWIFAAYKWPGRDGTSRAIKQVCGHKESFTLTRKQHQHRQTNRQKKKLFSIIMLDHDVLITMRSLFGTTIATATICLHFDTLSTAVWKH